MPIAIDAIYRYPIKGLSAESLSQAELKAGEALPHDRRFAIAHTATHIDPNNPVWLPKTRFFMLMQDEKLAQLNTRFDDTTGHLRIEQAGCAVLDASLVQPEGRKKAEAFFAEFLANPPGGRPHIVEAPGHTFSDAKQKPNSTTYKYISLVNLASVRALEEPAQMSVDPLRFRANFYFDGAPAWNELSWVDAEIVVGEARLKVVSPITRCPATSVNPATAERDLDIPRLLVREFGHNYMGIYAQVIGGGTVRNNDRLTPPA